MELTPALPSERLDRPNLPHGWQATENALGGVDMYIPDPRHIRRYVAACALVLATMAGWRAFLNWPPALRESAAVWSAITVLLVLFAFWCAFADERWRMARNYFEHRISIGGYVHAGRYRDAELEIVCRTDSRGKPYFRLYAVVTGAPHFLMERDEEELQQLAAFIAFHTRWPVRLLQS